MSQYLRCYQLGGSYFFTVVTHRRPIFINPDMDYIQMKFDLVDYAPGGTNPPYILAVFEQAGQNQ